MNETLKVSGQNVTVSHAEKQNLAWFDPRKYAPEVLAATGIVITAAAGPLAIVEAGAIGYVAGKIIKNQASSQPGRKVTVIA